MDAGRHRLVAGGMPLCALLLLLLLDFALVSTSAVVSRSLSARPRQAPELSDASNTLVVTSIDDVIYGQDGGEDVLHRHRRTTTSGIGISSDVGECILLFGALYTGEQQVCMCR